MIGVGAQVRFTAVFRITVAIRGARAARERALSGRAITACAIGRREATLTRETRRAIRSAAIDVGFFAVLHAISARRFGATTRAAHAALTITARAAAEPDRARLARAAAAIHVRLTATLRAVGAARGLTRAFDTAAFFAIGRRVAALRERARLAISAAIHVGFAVIEFRISAVRQSAGSIFDERKARHRAGRKAPRRDQADRTHNAGERKLEHRSSNVLRRIRACCERSVKVLL